MNYSEEDKREKKDKLYGIIGTIGFHIIFVLFLLFSAFRTPLPLPGEEGVEVNLGYSDDGFGDIQPLVPSQASTSAVAPSSSSEQNFLTSDNEEISLKENSNKPISENKNNTKPTNNQTQSQEQDPVVNPSALYKGKSNVGDNQGGNQGITGNPGDQGKPTGTPGSDNYTGNGGSGSGVSYDLGGRGVRILPKPIYNSVEQGKIVVNIRVNRQGVVTYAAAGAKGTTISELNLRKNAEIAAKQTKFAPDNNAPDEQRGTITYIFLKTN